MAATYTLYVDDSGNKEYSSDGKYPPSGGGKTLWFVFAGLIVDDAGANKAHLRLRRLKQDTFGCADVEIKANWLRMKHERERRYLTPFSISETDLVKFTNSVYELICEINCQLLSCVVNKADVQEQYAKPHYAPSIAYDCLLQRAQYAMDDLNGRLRVVVDDMSGATPKGSAYRENLERQHRLLRANGSVLRRGLKLDRVGELGFRDSKHDERLQLADLVAYAVYRQFVDYGPEWERPGKKLPVYEYFGRLLRCFRNFDGRVQGYGIVRFPMNRRVPWSLAKKKP